MLELELKHQVEGQPAVAEEEEEEMQLAAAARH